jgi:Phage integrase family
VNRAGLAPLRIHDLRHSAASVAIEAGAHPKQIQALLGHSSITTTLDRYGHLLPGMDEALAERMDGVGRAASGTSGSAPQPSPGATAELLAIPWRSAKNVVSSNASPDDMRFAIDD